MLAMALSVAEGSAATAASSGALTGTVTLPPVTTVELALTQGPYVTDPVTMSATVRDSVVVSQTPTGSVQFSYSLNRGPTKALGPTVTLDTSGAAVLSLDQGLPSVGAGPYSFVIRAAYNPGPASAFTSDSSAPLLVGFQGSDPPLCGSRCPDPDPQAMVAIVPDGSLVFSTPYTPTHPFDFGAMTLNANATELRASVTSTAAADPGNPEPSTDITITDTRPGNVGWTASAQTTDFIGPPGNTTPIPGNNLSFSEVTPKYLGGNVLKEGSVSTNDITAFGTQAKPYAHTTDGQGPGTVKINGSFSLTAATSTRAGVYSATVTFTVA